MSTAKKLPPASDHITMEDVRDLGFGSKVTSATRDRFLNRDGTFNVKRVGLSFLRSRNWFHSLIMISWARLWLLILLGYVAVNALFAIAYLACGSGALAGSTATGLGARFTDAFFFSVQTLATIGYGGMHPKGLPANILVALEALIGLCVFAFATGLIFSRFSRPVARVMFSDFAVIAPYHGMTAFEFRVINMVHNELIDVNVEVTFSSLTQSSGGERKRRFEVLRLERPEVTFFPLQWTVVHPIDKDSPLNGCDETGLREREGEFIVMLRATEETFFQQVRARTSYRAEEVRWGRRFASMFVDSSDGIVRADMGRLNDLEDTPPPAAVDA